LPILFGSCCELLVYRAGDPAADDPDGPLALDPAGSMPALVITKEKHAIGRVAE
jgi:hypothetical protein